MKTFSQKVDLRSREAMVAFLSHHFRYWTMNSWNRSSSYANCVKVHKLDLAPEQLERAWSLIECDEVLAGLNRLIADWAAKHHWRGQVGFNGRSRGYLVLLQGQLDHENARTARCDECAKATWHTRDTACTTIGCPGTLRVLSELIPQIVTYPGRGTDDGEDFDAWDLDSLRDRVKLVQDFDRLCDDLVHAFVEFCDHFEAVDEGIMVPKKVKLLQAR